jgi:DinB family protein
MKTQTTAVLLGSLILSAVSFAAETPTVAKLFDGPVSAAEKEIISLVEAMPADKFNFAPTSGEFKGVRTFAAQAKHLAAVVYMVSAASLSEKPPIELGGEDGPASVKTKEQIVEFMKGAFAYAHKAALALTPQNELQMVKSPFGQGEMARAASVDIIGWHSFDHYGQMVEYARMNGIIPPASR